MEIHKQRTAKVVDDNDPAVQGRIQVRIFPELIDVNEEHLPWARPMSSGTLGTGDDTGKHSPPEIDSFIEVCIQDAYWKEIYYYPHGSFIPGKYIYPLASENISDIEEIESFDYPQPRLSHTKDGTTFFHNTETGDLGFKHSSGTYAVINSEGQLTIDTQGVKFQINADGELVTTVDKLIINGELQVGDGSDNIVKFNDLKNILELLLNHVHISPVGMVTPAQESNGTPLSAYQGDIMKIKSEISTTD